MILVPGRAFDRAGTRLGRGGGAYDRILAGLQAPKIGVAFACQLVENLPREPHDVPMDAVVTSREIIRIG
jgi:5-formyltetrahydrofolate cyclo-ligase